MERCQDSRHRGVLFRPARLLGAVSDRICGLRVVEHGWFQASPQLKQAGPIDEAE